MTDIHWISTYGGRFIVLEESLLSEWHGFPDDGRDPLDTSHDYGRACALDGLAATLNVGEGVGLVFGENKCGGVWSLAELPILFEWIYADNEDAVVSALSVVPNILEPDETTEYSIGRGPLVVFDSAFAGVEFEPQHSHRFVMPEGDYLVASTIYEPNDNTGLILHRFLATNRPH